MSLASLESFNIWFTSQGGSLVEGLISFSEFEEGGRGVVALRDIPVQFSAPSYLKCYKSIELLGKHHAFQTSAIFSSIDANSVASEVNTCRMAKVQPWEGMGRLDFMHALGRGKRRK
jgi:hypothetical protein